MTEVMLPSRPALLALLRGRSRLKETDVANVEASVGSRFALGVIGIVGSSGVGKTTLLERLLPALESRGIAVGAAKHASHGFLADRPGKDSHRLYEAGARAVALISTEQVAVFRRLDGSLVRPPALADALAALPPSLDFVLAEGFAWEPIPRVVLVGPDETPRSEHLECGSASYPTYPAESSLSAISVPPARCGPALAKPRGPGRSRRPARPAEGSRCS